MKRLFNCVGMSVLLCLGWLSASASACPVATGIALAVPVAQVQLATPVVAVPTVAMPIVVAPPALSIVAAPVAVLASSVVVEKVRVRSSRRFRTPVCSLLFR